MPRRLAAQAAWIVALALGACSSDDAPVERDLAATPADLSGFVMDLSTTRDLALAADLATNADMTPVLCTSLDGKFTVNGGLPQTMNTVNTGIAAGALHVSMSCAAPTAYTWSVMSGSCGAGAGASNMGRSYDCVLAAGTSVSFNITNQSNPGVIATRVFQAP